MSLPESSRRDLLRLASTGMLGFGCLPVVNAFSGGERSVAKGPVRAIDGISAQDKDRTVFLGPGEGDKGKLDDAELVFKLAKSQTEGHLGSIEGVLPPGNIGAPPHYHKDTDEICVVLEGELEILVDEKVYTVPNGGWHLRPKGVSHCFWNRGTVPARFIEMYTPGGFEEFFRELLKLSETGLRKKSDAELKTILDTLAAHHDIVFQLERMPRIIELMQRPTKSH